MTCPPNVSLKQTLSHSSSVLWLKLTKACWWALLAEQFWWQRFEPIQRRFFLMWTPFFIRTPALDTFGCFLNVWIIVRCYESVRFKGSQPIQTMPILFTLEQLWDHPHLRHIYWFPATSWLFLIIRSNILEGNVFERNKCCARQNNKDH